jgi:peptidoglycan lytic transglycosylase G
MSKIAPAVVVLLAAATIGIVAWSISLVPSTILRSEPSNALGPTPVVGVATVTVEDGDGAKHIAEELQEAGVIQSARLFRVLVAFMGIENELQAGDYEFDKGMTTLAVIDRLHNGITAPLMVTVPEGLRVEEIADLLDEKGAVSKDDFLAAARADHPESFLPEGAGDNDLQGYLFPATYGFSRTATGGQAVQQMLDAFDELVVAEVQPQLETTGLTLDQVIALASIVEREAVKPEERPLIASVFLNRMKVGIALQADPTVQFALANDPENVAKYGYWKKELSLADLEVDSPYNTYKNSGLPPGPIACPGLDSIEAVLRPARTNYLFFVAKDDGSHVFAETLEEHLRNAQLYQP